MVRALQPELAKEYLSIWASAKAGSLPCHLINKSDWYDQVQSMLLSEPTEGSQTLCFFISGEKYEMQ